MTYNELISRFEVFDNPPKKDGYDRHHIVPKSEQTKPDGRQIYVSLSMHMWLHILYDREHGTKTATRFLNICGKPAEYFDCWEKCLAYSYTLRKKDGERKKKLAEVQKTPEFRQKLAEAINRPEVIQKMSDSKKGEKNPNYGQHRSEETKKKIADSHKGMIFIEEHRQNLSKSHEGIIFTEEHRQNLSDSMKGINTWSKGQKWFNNGIKNVRAYSCPDGFVSGMLCNK